MIAIQQVSREERIREYQRYCQVFANQLYEVVKRMPAPSIRLDLKTGEMTTVNDPKWEALIEKIKKQQQEILNQEFSDLLSTSTGTME